MVSNGCWDPSFTGAELTLVWPQGMRIQVILNGCPQMAALNSRSDILQIDIRFSKCKPDKIIDPYLPRWILCLEPQTEY